MCPPNGNWMCVQLVLSNCCIRPRASLGPQPQSVDAETPAIHPCHPLLPWTNLTTRRRDRDTVETVWPETKQQSPRCVWYGIQWAWHLVRRCGDDDVPRAPNPVQCVHAEASRCYFGTRSARGLVLDMDTSKVGVRKGHNVYVRPYERMIGLHSSSINAGHSLERGPWKGIG